MLRSLNKLERYKVGATDGDIGSVSDFLVDDARWTVRYLVVETGGLLGGREVLVSPRSVADVDFSASRFQLTITVAKVKGSPSIDVHKPVSRQHEEDFSVYYGFPYYWGGAPFAASIMPVAVPVLPQERTPQPDAELHLRSAREVVGYHLEATDGAIGHVEDFIVDDESWEVRYLVVDTKNWWPGQRVLVAPEWATRVSWTERKVHLAMGRDAVRGSPPWSSAYPIDRTYELELAAHYGGIPGWAARDRSLSSRADPSSASSVSSHR